MLMSMLQLICLLFAVGRENRFNLAANKLLTQPFPTIIHSYTQVIAPDRSGHSFADLADSVSNGLSVWPRYRLNRHFIGH